MYRYIRYGSETIGSEGTHWTYAVFKTITIYYTHIGDIDNSEIRFLLGGKVHRFHQYIFRHVGQQLITLSIPPV